MDQTTFQMFIDGPWIAHVIALDFLAEHALMMEVLEQFDCVVGIAGCSFEVPRGEIFCVMGLSGSGKSTMVRHLNRLIEPTAGSIEVLGRDVVALSEEELRKLRAAHIGMVFQHMALGIWKNSIQQF